jgi:hypothetical protein
MMGGLIAFPSQALAWWVRQHPAACAGLQVAQGSNVDFRYTGFGAGGGDTYICDVPDNSSMPKTNLTTANVELYQAGAIASEAKACYADWNGQSGDCDSPSYATGTGHKTIALGDGDGYWDSGSDFGFVHVVAGGSSCRIAGIYYGGT